MENYRGTYAQINLQNLAYNVSQIVKEYSEYKYRFGVVKADCYGHCNIETVQTIIDAGANYLAVSSLEEALSIREHILNIPILCLGYINSEYIDICIQNNITITIISKEYLVDVISKYEPKDLSNLKVHIKVDTGMNRLGIKSNKELKYVVDKCIEYNIKLEGIFTHICKSEDKKETLVQFNKFKEFLDYVSYYKFDIVHLPSSMVLLNYDRLDCINGFRMGIAMYGFVPHDTIKFKSTFSLVSKIIQIKELKKGEGVSYDLNYIAPKDEKIAIVAIGYADRCKKKKYR